MSKVFIIANNYTAKLIVSNLEYILNDSITEIYLLAENHFPNDTYPFSSAKITLCKNIHEGIANSDVIIMAKTKYLIPSFIALNILNSSSSKHFS